MQILAAALLLGVATLLAVILFIVLVQRNGQAMAPPMGLPLISIILLALFIMDIPLAFLVSGMQTRAGLRRIASGTWRPPTQMNPSDYAGDTAKLLAVRQTTMIIALAILEGTAFFGCIAYLLEAQSFVLGIIILIIVLMTLNFPTQSRIRAWLERQTDRLAELRQQGGFAAES
jgi:hypothetical protein